MQRKKLIDGAFQADLKCPHCKGRDIHRHGMTRGFNVYVSRFKKWLDRFNGVATKYLPNYLG